MAKRTKSATPALDALRLRMQLEEDRRYEAEEKERGRDEDRTIEYAKTWAILFLTVFLVYSLAAHRDEMDELMRALSERWPIRK